MFKKIIVCALVVMYLYTLTFNVFMTSVFRIPTPLLFTLPLIFLFRDSTRKVFTYKWQLTVFFIAAMILYLVGYEDIKTFIVIIIVITCCALFFNFFIGNSLDKLRYSVFLFYALLLSSAVVMLLNHVFLERINQLRAFLTGEPQKILQSPSGIAAYIFTFGYQLAALASFLIVSSSVFRKNLLVQALAFTVSILLIFFGMNRSVLAIISVVLVLFWTLYYRFKTVFIFGTLIALTLSFSAAIHELSTGRKQNILAKNEKHVNENRSGLALENLKIIADNPFGLIWTGKSWDQVARHVPAFRLGEKGLITSHNAYLMFITYLGIVPGLTLLILFYHRILKVFIFLIKHIRDKKYALLASLCFSFLAISFNSFFHNDWLLGGSGPTLFLYFSVLHLSKLQQIP